jgi:AcrR family transcriptional regulator
MQAGIQQRPAQIPTDARQLRSRGALKAALLELLEERPFDSLSIREISARAGTGYATFFRNYPDKEALLADVASEEIASLLAMTQPIFRMENSAESTRALCQYIDTHRKLWSALLTGGAAGILRMEFIQQARQLAKHMPQPEGWLPADLAVVYGAGATMDLLAWWLGQDKSFTAQRIAEILDRLIIAPLVGDLARRGPNG